MRDMPAVEWYGASGRKYAFHAYELPQTFPRGHGGTYIYCRLTKGRWEPIYIGHGEFSECVGDGHPAAKEFLAKGATHVHLRPTADLSCRESEHRDLLETQQAVSDGHQETISYALDAACPTSAEPGILASKF